LEQPSSDRVDRGDRVGEPAGAARGFAALNPQQREAALHPAETGPLLIIAGAGSGKTHTLAHRVAHHLAGGADARRVLLLTFTRRAALDMTRRVQRLLSGAPPRVAAASPRGARLSWSGTFHGVANRLLRLHAHALGLDPSFSVLDRSDAADLLDLARNTLSLGQRKRRFPRKATCLAIYSHTVNARCRLEQSLESAFPWCASWAPELRRLFAAYVEAKQRQNLLDYDDLLLYWLHLMQEPALARHVRERFDHVLVDEYQDTNALQAEILLQLRPDGSGLTVVGDDAQSIYSFRAATVRNILDFPEHFDPPARVVMLEQNYRSTQPILEASNAVMQQATHRFAKNLFSRRPSAERPALVCVEDEDAQVDYVVERVLEHREAGIALNRQAVLLRASHHSDRLEIELSRRDIPFVKYGGLRFLEAAHVKDLLATLRLAENPRDAIAGFRVLQLLPGIGPAIARRALEHLEARRFETCSLESFEPPAAARVDWAPLCALLRRLCAGETPWEAQIGLVRAWYRPHLERLYDAAPVRDGDLEQLEVLSARYPSRERFLTELALDPPEASGDEAGPPHLDEDHLVLSTIHSAKGQEWDAVFVLNLSDGAIPSDLATGSPEQIDEERRLLYVAMTRARDHLHLVHPLRYYRHAQTRRGDQHLYAPRSRFLPDAVLDRFERRAIAQVPDADRATEPAAGPSLDIAARMRRMWQ